MGCLVRQLVRQAALVDGDGNTLRHQLDHFFRLRMQRRKRRILAGPKANRPVDLIVHQNRSADVERVRALRVLPFQGPRTSECLLRFRHARREEIDSIAVRAATRNIMRSPHREAVLVPLRQHAARYIEDLAAGAEIIPEQLLQATVIGGAQSMQKLQIPAESRQLCSLFQQLYFRAGQAPVRHIARKSLNQRRSAICGHQLQQNLKHHPATRFCIDRQSMTPRQRPVFQVLQNSLDLLFLLRDHQVQETLLNRLRSGVPCDSFKGQIDPRHPARKALGEHQVRRTLKQRSQFVAMPGHFGEIIRH